VKLAVPFELRIFLIVVLVGIISVLVILDTPEPAPPVMTSRVVQGLQQPGEPSNTLIISGIAIGQAIGAKSQTISGNEFACFADKTIVTDRGRTTARYFLSLYDAVNGGCRVEFTETEERKTGLFMRCPAEQKIFDFTISFEPSLNSDIEDGELEDLQGEGIPWFGVRYDLVKAEVNDNVKLRFIRPSGTLDLEDNYADTAFSDKVEVNGKRAQRAQVRIRATKAGDEFMIHSIEYRVFPMPEVGKDIFVPDHQGVKQKMRVKETFPDEFDLLFRGLGTAPPKVSTPKPSIATRYAGSVFALDAVGDDTYYMRFRNTRGQPYNFPRMTVEGGALKSGDEDQDFIFQGSGASFNIDQSDLFAVSSGTGRNDVTNIVKYDTIDFAQGLIYLTDLAGGQVIGRFDTTTGDSTQPAIIGGEEYIFKVDTADAAHPIRFDHNGDGSLGGEAILIIEGGFQADQSSSGGTFHIPETLYVDEAPAGGETVTYTFVEEDGDIDVTASGVTFVKNDVTGKNEALLEFGVLAQRDNRNTANDLVFYLPSGRVSPVVTIPSPYVPGGQAQGEVLITCERSEFVKRAQEAKKKKAMG
jgi:hypothetical protein